VPAFAINPAETPRLFKSSAPALKPFELSPLTFQRNTSDENTTHRLVSMR
jgi:hypothetical protein